MARTTEGRERQRARVREWKRRNKKRHGELNRRSALKRREESPERHILKNAKRHAGVRGLEVSITAADIVIPEKCPYLDLPLMFGKGRSHDASPSIDRIDPAKRYVPGNVQVISEKANRMKSNASPEQLLLFARRVLERGQLGAAVQPPLLKG